ncbi:MAG: 3-deoxy-D-manno-octulosonic acid transferase [Alphaproteobacteria bacterium]|nr:3-deoxy-D-manno-octulosonic acid transferase [Alphaproteobacteria bacterium]
MTALFFYKCLCILLYPFILIFIGFRLLKNKEDKSRLNERLGFPKKERPKGKLIWMHGASVGECLSMLPLVKKMLDEDKSMHVMVTSGTVTSAELMKKRLPERAFHQFIPIDTPLAAKRFVKYWNADAVLWFESDFWPNMLTAIKKNKKPLILLNGRISDKSFARWQKHPYIIKTIQSLFTLSFGQTQEDARRLKVLGAENVVSTGNLKFAAVNPPFDQEELKKIHQAINNRPCWTMASTHENEELQGAEIHITLKEKYPDLLTVFVPRHPNRADALIMQFEKKGLKVARRSKSEEITADTDIYMADTIGEMGLLYQLTDFVFVGGSLIAFGGQNMLEPMRLKRAVVIGPYAFNFKEIVATAKEKNALVEVQNKEELSSILAQFLIKPAHFSEMRENAERLATSEMSVLDRVWEILHQKFNI